MTGVSAGKLRDRLALNRGKSQQHGPANEQNGLWLSQCNASNRLSSPRSPGKSSNRGKFQKDIFCEARPHSGTGLVQQTVQIVASLRSHDLTLFVRPEPRGDHDLPSIVPRLLSRLGHLFGKRIDKLLRKILNACLPSSFDDLPCFWILFLT